MPKGRPSTRPRRRNAQEAHEAIRPTSFGRDPDAVAGHLGRDEARLYRLIWQRALASQMKEKELETTTVELAADPYELRATATRTVFDGFSRVYTEGLDDTAEEAERTLPALGEGDATTRRRRDPDAALHRAAAALHRGLPDQGPRGARHRAPVDLCGDDLDDRRPRLRDRPRAAAPSGAGRRDRDRPARRPLRRVRRPRVHRPDGGRSSTRSPAASGRGCRCCATSTGRSRRSSTRSDASSSGATSRPSRPTRSARSAIRWSSGSAGTVGSWPARCTPSTRSRGPLPGEEPDVPADARRRRAVPDVRRDRRRSPRRPARPVRPIRRLRPLPGVRLHQEGRSAAPGAAAVRGRLPDLRRGPSRRPSRSADRVASSGGARATRSARSRPRASRSGRPTTPTPARSPGSARARRRCLKCGAADGPARRRRSVARGPSARGGPAGPGGSCPPAAGAVEGAAAGDRRRGAPRSDRAGTALAASRGVGAA